LHLFVFHSLFVRIIHVYVEFSFRFDHARAYSLAPVTC